MLAQGGADRLEDHWAVYKVEAAERRRRSILTVRVRQHFRARCIASPSQTTILFTSVTAPTEGCNFLRRKVSTSSRYSSTAPGRRQGRSAALLFRPTSSRNSSM